MRRTRNARSVAALGPAGAHTGVVRGLFMADVEEFRLKFSHGSAAAHRERRAVLRDAGKLCLLVECCGADLAVTRSVEGGRLSRLMRRMTRRAGARHQAPTRCITSAGECAARDVWACCRGPGLRCCSSRARSTDQRRPGRGNAAAARQAWVLHALTGAT